MTAYALLLRVTGTQDRHWDALDGPLTRAGNDSSWYRHRDGREACLHVDQGHAIVVVDGVTLYAGYLTDEEDDDGSDHTG